MYLKNVREGAIASARDRPGHRARVSKEGRAFRVVIRAGDEAVASECFRQCLRFGSTSSICSRE